MRFLQRSDNQQQHQAPGNDGPDSGEQLQQLRSEGDRLLAAGDDAIQRALNGVSSEAFLRASRQQGGQ